MSFASLINLCPRQSPLSRSSRKSSRSSYNPSVKWKSFEKKVSLHFSRTMPLICAHLLISSPSFTALRLALSRRARCESFPDLTLLEVFAFLFQTTDGSGRVIFKMFERPWHRFSCPLLPFFFVHPLFISCCLYSNRRRPLALLASSFHCPLFSSAYSLTA